ncbi:MAG: hypothetical protein A2X49_14905 [Lentisphaerae bacterium GWF2_52_8]|nr:MAG: hypothetical protein A2X49_14905 [Lentisphaerae bacterium GWF2_52_8]
MEIRIETWDEGNLIVNAEYADILKHNNILSAEKLWAINSESVKNVVKDRGTERSYLEPLNGTDFIETYIKRYQPTNFSAVISTMLSFKPAPLDAFGEWQAMLDFHKLGLSTLVPIAVGRSLSGTCNLTLGVKDYVRASALLETLGAGDRARKLELIDKIARLVGGMHAAGFAHRDCYLLHFFVQPAINDAVCVIDLQRIVRELPLGRRWRVKDLAQLLFSAKGLVSRTDATRFCRRYSEITGTPLLRNKTLIRDIQEKASSIYERERRKLRN